jgi:hypothetical protein
MTCEGVELQLLHSLSGHYIGVNGQLRAPAALPMEKRLRYPLDERVGGPQSRFGRCRE